MLQSQLGDAGFTDDQRVIAETIILMRRVAETNTATHEGIWLKTAAGSYEVRGKKMGIVGYGHIGSQVSVLAEAMGMKVYYYDVEPKLIMGNAIAISSLDELLEILRKEIDVLHHLAKELLKYETIDSKDLKIILEGKNLTRPINAKVSNKQNARKRSATHYKTNLIFLH